MAEILFYEDRVTRTCGADTLVRALAAPACGISAVNAVESAGEESQPSERRAGNPRSGRLLRHADFERVYKQGRRHFSASMTVFYLQREQGAVETSAPAAASGLRVGFTVGRALGGAVQRNRMKRRLREAVRVTRSTMKPDTVQLAVDVVINPKKSILTADFSAVMNEVSRAFVVIEQKLGAKSTAKENSWKPEAGSRKPN